MNVVILGAGQAAASAAAKLRALGHDGPITLIGDEPTAPYQRPPLSKAYLLGDMARDRLMLRTDEWWAEQNITLRLSERATAIDRDARRVVTDKGEVAYDNLVLALGASPRRLPQALGGNLPNVYCVRNLADIDRMSPQMQAGRNLVVIGGGYIGLEAAAVARKLGLTVTLIEAAPRILARVASAETAEMIRALHRSHDVEILEATDILRLTGTEHVTGVELRSGRHIPADLVICGIGVEPETALAKAAGLQIECGIVTDAFGRTSDPLIWAAGDCASLPGQGAPFRLESVGNAIDMAEAVAANIMGAAAPYHPKPWFWSDQFDAKLQIAGLNHGFTRTVLRKAGDHSGSVWYFDKDRLIAVDALNDARAYMIGKRLIEAGRSPLPDQIAAAPDLKALLS